MRPKDKTDFSCQPRTDYTRHFCILLSRLAALLILDGIVHYFRQRPAKRLLCSNTQGAAHSQSSGSKMVAANTDAPTPGVASRIQRGSHKPKVDFIGHLIAHSASDVYQTSGSSIVTVALRCEFGMGTPKSGPIMPRRGRRPTKRSLRQSNRS